MGAHLIPGAASIHEAADHIGEPSLTASWSWAEGGVLFTDTALTDGECAALYADFTPSGATDMEYRRPPPPAVQDAIDTLRAFYNANPATVTDAQAATLHRAEVVILRHLYRDMEEPL